MNNSSEYGRPIAYFGPFSEEEARSIREVLDKDLPAPIGVHESKESFDASPQGVLRMLAERKSEA